MACCPALFDHKVLYQMAARRKRRSVGARGPENTNLQNNPMH